MDLKYSCEIVRIYTAPNEDILAIERSAARTLTTRNLRIRIVIGGDLNLTAADWKGEVEGASGFQEMVDNLVWDNGYTQRPYKRRRAVVYIPSQN